MFDDSSDLFKTENGHHSINLTDDVFHLQSLFKHKTGILLKECTGIDFQKKILGPTGP